MLFFILKLYARFILRLCLRRVIINKPAYLQAKGPLLFAANHPNSFLDGIILTTLMEATLYSLARGDAFSGRWNRWLRRLHLLPVYRTSEGVGNLAHNYTTFSECHTVFGQGGVVLIFSEGGCLNEWRLRPLRKGTARLAISAWEKDIDLTVVPLGFNYSNFRNFGKDVHLLFGEPLHRAAIMEHGQDGKQFALFNQQLRSQLEMLVYEIPPGNEAARQQHFPAAAGRNRQWVLALPALLGWLLHAPLRLAAHALAGRFDREHHDGVLVAVWLLFYPLYLGLLLAVAVPFLGWHALWLLLLSPVGAWAYVQVK